MVHQPGGNADDTNEGAAYGGIHIHRRDIYTVDSRSHAPVPETRIAAGACRNCYATHADWYDACVDGLSHDAYATERGLNADRHADRPAGHAVVDCFAQPGADGGADTIASAVFDADNDANIVTDARGRDAGSDGDADGNPHADRAGAGVVRAERHHLCGQCGRRPRDRRGA